MQNYSNYRIIDVKNTPVFNTKFILLLICYIFFLSNVSGEKIDYLNFKSTEETTPSEDCSPTAMCVANLNLALDATGNAILLPEYIDAGSYEGCENITLSVSPNMFDCTDVGTTTVVFLTVTDEEGNTIQCSSNVLVEDKFPPTVNCNAQVTVSLGLDGTATITPDMLIASSNDNCDLTYELSQDTFDCDDIGNSTFVYLTATDAGGNTSQCLTEVIVVDNIEIDILWPSDVLDIECGSSTDPPATGEPIIIDNCGTFATGYQDQIFNSGGNTIKIIRTWQVTEWLSGDVYTYLQLIKTIDTTPPTAVCFANINISLDQTGNAILVPEAVDAGSFDDCGDVTLSVSPNSFDCNDVGNTITVILTVTDENFNTNQCTTSVLVEDKMAPTAVCNAQVNVSLGADGTATITPAVIDAGSYDNCGPVTFSLNQSTFSCSDIGDSIVVILTVTDGSGNTNICWSEIVVEDKMAPDVTCPADITIVGCEYGDGTDPIITGYPIVVDNCDLIAYAYDDQIFDFGGGYKILRTWNIVDWYSGSVQECVQIIKLIDIIPPYIECVEQANVSLDNSGQILLNAEDFVELVTDDCDMLITLAVFPNQFDCSSIGETTVVITATDESGNQSECYVDITIEDKMAPTAVCNAQVNVSLGADGTATITPAIIDAGSYDNCGPVTFNLSQSTFDCTDIGDSLVVLLTVTDSSGNTNICWSQIVVEDKMPPVVSCPPDLTIDCSDGDNLDPDITGYPTVVDNCDQTAYAYEDLILPTCGSSFKVLRTWTIVDWYSGSVQECIQVIKVQDVTPPELICLTQLTASLDNSGSLTLYAEDLIISATDDCDSVFLSLLQNQFDCSDIGDTTVEVTAMDGCGNMSQCNVLVYIVDNTPPTAVCQSQVNISLGIEGTATITPDVIDAGSYDACGPVTISLSQSTFDCSDIGSGITVILTATDESGNMNECWSEVFVEDKIPPVATCPPDIIADCSLGDNPDPNLTGFPSVVDNCDAIGYSYEDLVFPLGGANVKILRTWIVVDWYSLSFDTCYQMIKLFDTSPPNIICLNQLVASLDANGNLTLFPNDFDAGTTDDCGTFELSIDQSQFDCSDVGTTIVTVTATDDSGNTSQCMVDVIISGLDADQDGYSLCEGDCNDNDGSISPGSPEICADGIDNNCDSQIDENCICPSYGQSTQFEWIESISVNGTANTTGDDGGYGDYTSVTLQVDIGNNTVQLVPEFSGNKKKEFWSIWIDFNHNAQFDANEEVFNDDSKFAINSSFAIPNTAILGVTTMRIAMRFNQYSDPCEIFTRGEVEDYSVNINEPYNCISGGQSTQYEWIKKVQLKSINNTSGNDNGYADYTNLSTNLNPGQSKNIKLQPGFSGNSFTEYWRVWVDWNTDGDFDDAGELEVETSSSGNVTEQITVPATASGGDKIMRVSMKYGGYADPCEVFTYGEVEDYTIFVTGSNPLINVVTPPKAIIIDEQKTELIEIANRDLGLKFGMKLYPNPVSNILNIKIISSIQNERTIKIYNHLGQVWYDVKTDQDQHFIDISSDKFTSGMYMVVIQQGKEILSQKLLVTK